MKRLRLGLCLICLVIASGGCAPMETISTDILVRDPTGVALERSDGEVVVPATSEIGEAPLGEGRIATSPDSSAGFEVVGRREEDHSIALEWSTSLPMTRGERYTVLPADGRISLKEPLSAVVTPAMRKVEHLILPWCSTIGMGGYRTSSYRVEPRGCTDTSVARTESPGSGIVPYVLDTPWSNVIEIHERRRIDKGSAWLIIGASTLSFGAFSTMFFSFRSSAFKGGLPTKIALGASSAAIGLAFDLTMLPTLLAEDRDVVIRH